MYAVQIYSRSHGYIRAEDGATLGATLGVNVYNPDGSLLELSPSAVTSVFGRTGAVIAQAGDYSLGQITGLQAALDGKAAASHTHTKADVGLGNVDNTSDAAKPVSTATQAALNAKASLRAVVSFNDITTHRDDPTGVLWLGNTGSRYLYYDGGNYIMPGANLWVNGAPVWTSGTFDPATKLGVAAKAADSELLDGLNSDRYWYGDNENLTRSRFVGDMNTPQPSGFYEFQPGSANSPTTNWTWAINFRHTNTDGVVGQYGFQLSNPIGGNALHIRSVSAGNWTGWDRLLVASEASDVASNGTIVRRGPSGYIFANYINTTADVTTATPSHVAVFTGNDNYIRQQTLAQVSQYIAPFIPQYRLAFTANINAGHGIGTTSGSMGAIEVQANGADTPGAAMISFHRIGSFAAYFGLDTDNVWKVGGWSMGGNAYRLYHAGSGNIAHNGQISANSLAATNSNGVYIYGNGSGLEVMGPLYENGQTYKLAANGAAWIRNPRHFVQSTDPGAQAQDGDIWTNTA